MQVDMESVQGHEVLAALGDGAGLWHFLLLVPQTLGCIFKPNPGVGVAHVHALQALSRVNPILGETRGRGLEPPRVWSCFGLPSFDEMRGGRTRHAQRVWPIQGRTQCPRVLRNGFRQPGIPLLKLRGMRPRKLGTRLPDLRGECHESRDEGNLPS